MSALPISVLADDQIPSNCTTAKTRACGVGDDQRWYVCVEGKATVEGGICNQGTTCKEYGNDTIHCDEPTTSK
ncbi:hypothetical protein VTN02DRAFT_6415 [Thermoascus thermophilus]